MDINIQAKFGIGDKLWIPGHYYEWYPIKTERVVFGIKIDITSQDQRIFYIVEDCDNCTETLPERLCFSSYDECKQWCDKENR